MSPPSQSNLPSRSNLPPRQRPRPVKLDPCRNFQNSHCPIGNRCRYPHIPLESNPAISSLPVDDFPEPNFNCDHFDQCAGPQFHDFGRVPVPCKECEKFVKETLDDDQLRTRDALIQIQQVVFEDELQSYNIADVEHLRNDPEYFERTRQRGDEIHQYTVTCITNIDRAIDTSV